MYRTFLSLPPPSSLTGHSSSLPALGFRQPSPALINRNNETNIILTSDRTTSTEKIGEEHCYCLYMMKHFLFVLFGPILGSGFSAFYLNIIVFPHSIVFSQLSKDNVWHWTLMFSFRHRGSWGNCYVKSLAQCSVKCMYTWNTWSW